MTDIHASTPPRGWHECVNPNLRLAGVAFERDDMSASVVRTWGGFRYRIGDELDGQVHLTARDAALFCEAEIMRRGR